MTRGMAWWCVSIATLLTSGCAARATPPAVGAGEPSTRGEALAVSAVAEAPTAIAAATGFVQGLDAIEWGRTSITLELEPEQFARGTAAIVREGFLDDSVDGDFHRLRLARSEAGNWSVTAAERWRKCKPGRGPNGWTSATCF